MSKKFLGRMVAGAALAGACLLSTAPGAAAATADGGGGDHHEKGIIKTFPQWAKPGHEVKVLQICSKPQPKAWAWSEVTGKVKLWPWKGPLRPEMVEEYAAPPNGDAMSEPRNAVPNGEKKWDKKKAEANGLKDGVGGDEVDGQKDGVKRKHFVYWGSAEIPSYADPGKYKLKGSCAYGHLYVVPNGGVDGGDGGTSDTNTSLAVSGAGVLAAAGIGGIVMMRRRRTDGSIA
ncbi:hypothetical protein ABN028_16570 [Actinopolymorpha sp. B17G11]|uniref:hypothetical protein n=1 Tax=unclassified Actinopolymorpha TaxID=2627063 RepID=UPI0032D90AE2